MKIMMIIHGNVSLDWVLSYKSARTNWYYRSWDGFLTYRLKSLVDRNKGLGWKIMVGQIIEETVGQVEVRIEDKSVGI